MLQDFKSVSDHFWTFGIKGLITCSDYPEDNSNNYFQNVEAAQWTQYTTKGKREIIIIVFWVI